MKFFRLMLITLSYLLGSIAYFFDPYENGKELSTVSLGSKFIFSWDSVDPYIQIHHVDEPNRVLFRTLPSWPFVTVGFSTDSNPPIVDGNLKVNEWTLFETPYQNIKRVTVVENEVTVHGTAWGLVTIAEYEMKFTYSPQSAHISFNLTATPVQGTFNRLFLNYWCDTSENFYGFGVQVVNQVWK